MAMGTALTVVLSASLSGCMTVSMTGGSAVVGASLEAAEGRRLAELAGGLCEVCGDRGLTSLRSAWEGFGRWMTGGATASELATDDTTAAYVQRVALAPGGAGQVAADTRLVAERLDDLTAASAALRASAARPVRTDVLALEKALTCAVQAARTVEGAAAALGEGAARGELTRLNRAVDAGLAEVEALTAAFDSAEAADAGA
jgi:hypothetical protein